MDYGEEKVMLELKERTSKIYSQFMTRVANFDELVAVGTKLLTNFQQGLDVLRRPPMNITSKLVESIIKANETERVKLYVEAGCSTAHDRVQSVHKLHTCLLGLQEHLSKAKSILNELECFMEEVVAVVQTEIKNVALLMDKNVDMLDLEETTHDKEMMASVSQKPYITDYAALVGMMYSMVKQDYLMQERIVNSLSLKSSSGELDSYSVMWSLRPFINEEIMHQAWRLI